MWGMIYQILLTSPVPSSEVPVISADKKHIYIYETVII